MLTSMLLAGLMASPVVIGDDLLLRTKTHVVRVGERGE